jgi:hypothetical protein
MPLVNSPTLTPKKLAANRANAQLSRRPITLEGLIRVRDANIKHGAYAQDMGEALRVLGEDPKDFDQLLESLKATWQPANELEGRLVKRLGRAIWRAERNDCLQAPAGEPCRAPGERNDVARGPVGGEGVRAA